MMVCIVSVFWSRGDRQRGKRNEGRGLLVGRRDIHIPILFFLMILLDAETNITCVWFGSVQLSST